LFDRVARKRCAMRHVETAAPGFAKRGAGGGDDYGIGHVDSLLLGFAATGKKTGGLRIK
jgi:hypothetical protein